MPTWVAVTDIKQKLTPKADGLTDGEILLAINAGEYRTETFLLSCNRPQPFSEEDNRFAKQHAIVTSSLYLLSALPIDVNERRALREALLDELKDLENGYIRRVYSTTVEVKSKMKFIPRKHEDFYKEELE